MSGIEVEVDKWYLLGENTTKDVAPRQGQLQSLVCTNERRTSATISRYAATDMLLHNVSLCLSDIR